MLEACVCQKQYLVMGYSFLSTLHATAQKPYFTVMSNYLQINKMTCQILPLFCVCAISYFSFSPFWNVKRWSIKGHFKNKNRAQSTFIRSGLFAFCYFVQNFFGNARKKMCIYAEKTQTHISHVSCLQASTMFLRGNARVQLRVQYV